MGQILLERKVNIKGELKLLRLPLFNVEFDGERALWPILR
jgi:hypothetical protein